MPVDPRNFDPRQTETAPLLDAGVMFVRDASHGVIVPAYQAAASLPAVLRGLAPWFDPDRILVVDDGSGDATSEAARSAGVRVERHEVNQGKGAALVTGLRRARALGWEWAVTLDADGQHAPEDLEGFLGARPGSRVGILNGCRARRGSRMPWHRRFSNASTTALVSRLAGRPVFDAQCGYRAYRLDALEALPEGGRFEWEAQALILAARAGWEIEKVPVRTVYAGEGSHMRLAADTLRFVRMAFRMLLTSRNSRTSRAQSFSQATSRASHASRAPHSPDAPRAPEAPWTR